MMAENNLNVHALSENRNEVELIVSSIRGKLHQHPPFPACSCIFRVPSVLRRHNERAFVPTLVSIGPFHHGKENLQLMQEIKLWYLQCLLDRMPTSETSLECFVEAIKSIEPHCRSCYGEKFDAGSEKFVEMLVVDGCFIIELFHRYAGVVPYDNDDPVQYTSWMRKVLKKDLFLLENQLPWKVLECLFHHTKENDNSDLLELALKFFKTTAFNQSTYLNKALESRHLLDVIRKSLLASYPQVASDRYWEPIPSVTELLQAGVEFKRKNNTWDNMLDITFEDGVMEIPPLDIEYYADSLFRNLIAYEQCDPNIPICNITSYAVILDNLINSSKDAEFLVQKRIITTILSKEDLACFFNGLYNDTIPGHFSYVQLTENVNAYYYHRWHRWQTILSRDYFSNPWSIMSFAAALVILVLTFMQTLYSMLSYY